MRKTNRLGFSLIELSIVILVIGILVVGITKGSRIINSARLDSARSLTKGSPVNSNNNVALWLETTSEASFSAKEATDQSTVTNWFDIKGSAITDPFNVTQTDVSKKPHYITNSTNGLPTLRFDGVNDNLKKATVAGSDFTNGGNQITIFVVQKYYTPAHNSSIFYWQSTTNANNRLNIHATWSDGGTYFDFGSSDGRISFSPNPATYSNKTNIITAFRRPNNTGAIRINGTQYGYSASLTSVLGTSQTSTFYVASLNEVFYQNSDINEIIIFRTALKDYEIQEIEQYLSVKWGVALKGL
jgi:prepilin-type N-terminal cleavage/methylation domain-containing protein